MTFPADCRYTKEHEWIRLDADGVATVGVTDYAQDQLGDIVFVELPSVGDTFEADAVFGTVEAVKTVSELYLPVAGEVVAINDGLNNGPDLVNTDPYGEGWMIKLRPTNPADLDALMSADDYQAMVG